MIKFDEWEKLDLKVAEVLSVEDHPNADKLYVIRVKLGDEERTIVAGLKEHYSKEDLKGKKIIVLTNLEPATLRGVKSEGMLLAAENKETCSLLVVDKDISSGTKVC